MTLPFLFVPEKQNDSLVSFALSSELSALTETATVNGLGSHH
jgi:hypothetical protein